MHYLKEFCEVFKNDVWVKLFLSSGLRKYKPVLYLHLQKKLESF